MTSITDINPITSMRVVMAAAWHACMQVALLTSVAAFPWVVKPLYGFLSDTVPIFGYRRRSYLVICGVLGARLLHCCCSTYQQQRACSGSSH